MDLNISQDFSALAILGFGFVLGLLHAKDPDHLAAVSTVVAEERSVLVSTLVGGCWGIGHTVSLLIVGALVIFLKFRISESLEAGLEGAVGLMLVFLGLNALRKLFGKTKLHVHTHEHGGRRHTHLHTHGNEAAEETHHYMRFRPRSILIGMVHGLAGSAGVMLLILPTITSTALAVLYILVFGIGSIAGMMAMSLVIGLPIHLTGGRFELFNRGILGAAGFFSLGFGVFLIYEKLLS